MPDLPKKPIFVATHPRSCSTAFERVFMTCRDRFTCVHEPFGDAFYYGPERLSKRYEQDESARVDSGMSKTTYKDVWESIKARKEEGKRLFIKDMAYYIVDVEHKNGQLAPSLADTSLSDGAHDAVDGEVDGEVDGKPSEGKIVIPHDLLEQLDYVFLIRDPHYAIPSWYRCTIGHLSELTGFNEFYPSEAGYEQLQILFDYLRASVIPGGSKPCVIDADGLLDDPCGTLKKVCDYVDEEFTDDMLSWEKPCDQEYAKEQFAKWKGFHEDALDSSCLKPRQNKKARKTEEEFDQEWREKYGEKAAAMIRRLVDENMGIYETLLSYC